MCKYYISTFGRGGGLTKNAYFAYLVRGSGGSRGKMLILLMQRMKILIHLKMVLTSVKYHLTLRSKAIYEKTSHTSLIYLMYWTRARNFVFKKLEFHTLRIAIQVLYKHLEKCNDCENEFQTKNHLNLHMKSKHSVED